MSKSSLSGNSNWRKDLSLPVQRISLQTVIIPENFHQSSGQSTSPPWLQSISIVPYLDDLLMAHSEKELCRDLDITQLSLQRPLPPKKPAEVPVGRTKRQRPRREHNESHQSKAISMVVERQGEPSQVGTLDTTHNIHTDQMPTVGVREPISTLAGPKASGPQRKKSSPIGNSWQLFSEPY